MVPSTFWKSVIKIFKYNIFSGNSKEQFSGKKENVLLKDYQNGILPDIFLVVQE